MNVSTNVLQTVTFPDAADELLRYLAERTAETVPRRVDRADVVAVGEVTSGRVLEVPAPPERTAALQAWVVPGEAPRLLVDVIEIAIERLLAGEAEATVTVAEPRLMQAGTGAGGPTLLPSTGTRGLAFLQRDGWPDAVAELLPADAHRLHPDEPGLLADREEDYDDEGRPVTRDCTAQLDEVAAAVAWYAELGAADDRVAALAEAVGSSNERIARAALRELADESGDAARTVLRDAAATASGEDATRVAIALWLAGDGAGAEALIAPVAASTDRLRFWGLTRSEGHDGAPILYGPDPRASRSD